jgi:hypothetical protein
MIQQPGEHADKGLALAGRQRREQLILGVGQQGVEPPQVCPALSGDRDDVAAAVILIGGPLGQLLGGEFVDGGHDVAAVHPGAAAQARLAGRAELLERRQQTEVIATRTRGGQAVHQPTNEALGPPTLAPPRRLTRL